MKPTRKVKTGSFCLASYAGKSGYSDREESEDEKRRKNVVELPAKNRRDWATSFILVNQLLDPGSQGGFRQTIITSPIP